MHGEYKMPGGKLIVADIAVDAGRFSYVQISGDFFLEPDSTLDVINASLVGLPADSSEPALAAAVDSALGPDVAMYGISPQAIAVAMRRAVESQP